MNVARFFLLLVIFPSLSRIDQASNQILAFQFKATTSLTSKSIAIPIKRTLRLPLFANLKDKSSTSLRDKENESSDIEKSGISTKESSSSGGKLQILGFIALLFTSISGLAYSGGLFDYPGPLIQRDQNAFLITSVLAFAFVKLCTYSANKGWLQSRDSRKIIHTFSAPLFIFVWPLFSGAYGARFFAALIPFTNMLRLYAAGSGKGGDETELAGAVSRSGDKEEALGGPFVYVIIMVLSTLLFWCDNLSGVTALTVMAVGDGTADLVGRRLGKSNKWSFNSDKSVAGSTAFFVLSFIATIALFLWLDFTGAIQLTMSLDFFVPRVAIICLISAFVETLPLGNDNWTVPVTAAFLSQLLLH